MHSWDLPGFTEQMAVAISLKDNLARFHDQPLLFAPGAEGEFQYTGTQAHNQRPVLL